MRGLKHDEQIYSRIPLCQSQFLLYFFHVNSCFKYKCNSIVTDGDISVLLKFGHDMFACSVKHEYDKPFDKEKAQLTCNPKLFPQEVKDEEEIIFTYDVKFKVELITYLNLSRIFVSMA